MNHRDARLIHALECLEDAYRPSSRVRDEQPRHNEDETRDLFANLDLADPRAALMIEVAPDQRAGQAIRATRRDLDIEPGAGGLGHGQLNLMRHGHGKKNATVIDLHEHARKRFYRSMAKGGHLYHLEQA